VAKSDAARLNAARPNAATITVIPGGLTPALSPLRPQEAADQQVGTIKAGLRKPALALKAVSSLGETDRGPPATRTRANAGSLEQRRNPRDRDRSPSDRSAGWLGCRSN
jgi:hypothetical protein